MTCRTVQNKSVGELAENHYLFYFQNERKYSIAQRKFIVCEDRELVLGSNLSVKDGGKLYIGCLMNEGKKKELEAVLKIQENMITTPETKELTQKRNHSPDNEESGESDMSGSDESYKAVGSKKSKSLRLFDSDDDDILANEEQKVKRLSKVMKFKEKSQVASESTATINKRLEKLECQVDEILKTIYEMKTTIKNSAHKSGSTFSRENMVDSSPSSRPSEKSVAKRESTETAIWHEEINLMNVNAPPKEPSKCAIKLLSCLFSPSELENGILFASKRSPKLALDAVRVTKLFDVLNAKYGEERIQKAHQMIVDACNQKCRDTRRKAKIITTPNIL